jgi:hypothetical protein
MSIFPASEKWSTLRCADPFCEHAATCLRWIDITSQNTAHPVAGSLMPPDQSPLIKCPWFIDPETGS